MNKLLFLFILCIPLQTFSQFNQDLSCLDDVDVSKLLETYWVLQEKQENLFNELSIDENGDLLSDGIGEWDEEKCLFTEAGKNIPGSVIRRRWDFDAETYNFQLSYGDSGLKIGDQLVTYSLEYDLLKSNNQDIAAEKTLNKIFLLLQAIRRLDMTANKYMQLYYENCDTEACPDFTPDLSGYTGFMLREDIPVKLDYNCEGIPGCPKSASSGLSEHKDKVEDSDCFESENIESTDNQCDIICCFPIWKVESGNGNISSQDQLIGILHGLSFVAKYIGRNETLSVNNKIFNIRSIVDKIAHGIHDQAKSCSNRIKYPGCDDPCDSENIALGNNTSAYYYGIAKTVSNITGDYINTSKWDWVKWNVLGHATTTAAANLWEQSFNNRMLFYLKMGAGSDFECHQMNDFFHTSSFNLAFEDLLLNEDSSIFDCLDNFTVTFFCDLFRSMEAIGCDVPCYELNDECGSPHFEYQISINSEIEPFIDIFANAHINWCGGASALHGNGFLGDPCRYTEAGYQSPIAYLHMLNLMIKTGFIKDVNYVNPSFINNNTEQTYLDIPSLICSDDVIEIQFPFDNSNIEITTSDNFNFFFDEDNIIIDPVEPVGINNEAFLEITIPSEEECKKDEIYIFNFEIHEDAENINFTYNVNSEDCSIKIYPRTSSTLPTNELEILSYKIEPEFINGQNWFTHSLDNNVINIDLSIDILEVLGIPVPEYIEYTIYVKSPCGGTKKVTKQVYIPDCEEDHDGGIKRIILSPNPKHNSSNVSVTIETKKNNSRATGNIYVRNNIGMFLVKEQYSTDEIPFIIENTVFVNGINNVVFTDLSTFEVSEQLIVIK